MKPCAVLLTALLVACGVPDSAPTPFTATPQRATPTRQQPTTTPLPTPLPAPTPSPLPTSPVRLVATIAFGTTLNGPGIVLGRQGDEQMVPLVTLLSQAVWPDSSPDGARLAFAVRQGERLDLAAGIYTIDVHTGVVQLIVAGAGNHPRWSPDGRLIAYTCGDDICTVEVATGDIDNLIINEATIEQFPAWTPDGRIVFMSNRDVPNGSEIYIMEADGTLIRRLTFDNGASNGYPDVSVNGTISHASDREVIVGSEIYTMSLIGDDVQRVTDDTVWNQAPRWSPDGTSLLYAAHDEGQIDLFELDVAAVEVERVISSPAEDGGLRRGHGYLRIPQEVSGAQAISPPRLAWSTEGETPSDPIFAASDLTCLDCLPSGIYRLSADGPTPLGVVGVAPVWVGDSVAFVRDGELFAVVEGEAVQLTDQAFGLRSLDWNATLGQFTAACTPYGQPDVCLIDGATGFIRNLTPDITPDSGLTAPEWRDNDIAAGGYLLSGEGAVIERLMTAGQRSPDGNRIAGISSGELYLANSDGSGRITLLADEALIGPVAWSPDSQRLLFSRASEDGRLRLWIFTLATNGDTPLLDQPVGQVEPALSLGFDWGHP